MSKKHENNGKLALMQGNNAQAAKRFDDAIKYYELAIAMYQSAITENPAIKNEPHLNTNFAAARLNLAASYIAVNKLEEAINFIKKANAEGFTSSDFDKNLAIAHYNLGCNLIDSSSSNYNAKKAIENFAAAKDLARNDAHILYNLGVAMIQDRRYDVAKTEFTELLNKGLPAVEFPLKLQLNSYCKLIECQLKLGENTTVALNDASKVLSSLNLSEHQEEAKLICSHLAVKYLIKDSPEEVQNIIKSASRDLETHKEIALGLEQYALSLYDGGDQKEVAKMLLTLAHVKEIVSDELLESIKSDLISISASQNNLESDNFSIKILGDIENCTHDDVDTLFS